ncbi:MAG: Type II secretion system protein E [bacterium ADurb.Bin400]|nr:MAG: Type II secretion system protein E [bacterium ADurb.Bin400]
MSDNKSDHNIPIAGLSENVLGGQSILDVFVLQDIMDVEDANKLKAHFKTNREVESFLVKNRLVTRETINKAYSILLKLPYIALENTEIPKEALKIIPEKLAHRYGIIPFSTNDNMVRIAVSRPADLLAKYPASLADFFLQKGLAVELFITGESDFNAAVTQYNPKKKQGVLVKRGSLPVVFLRNQRIPDKYLKKLPKDFIERYRIAVFGENRVGNYLLACETPDSMVTQKIVSFLEKENDIKVELFATSKDDINYIVKLYGQDAQNRPKLDIGYKDSQQEPEKGKTESKEKQGSEVEKSNKITLQGFLDSLIRRENEPEFTIDERPDFAKFEGEKVAEQSKSNPQKPETVEDSVPVKDDETVVERQENKQEEEVTEESVTKKEVTAGANEPEQAPTDKQAEGANSNTGSGQQQKIKETISAVVKPKGLANDAKTTEGKGLEAKDLGSLLGNEDIKNEEDLERVVKEGYVPKMVAAIIDYALHYKASDIHIEPGSKFLRVRCRVDGVLREAARIPQTFHPPIVSRIKILSRLKIDETRIPQDGRFDLIFKGRKVDVRVSMLPTVNGEKCVMRVLDKEKGMLSLEDLGMQGSAFDLTIDAINKPYGIILSTGPTGSGKSTTLYAVLSRLSVPGINIITLEDPVEYEIPSVNQCQVKPEIGFTFASGLRSVLRQDPNVIMVGEIRDAETAAMATHAALTGHLVLSTLHTNDTAGALPRMINMGVEPFLITSSINLVIAQRLVRRICPKCKEEMKVPPKLHDDVKKELESISPKNQVDRKRITPEIKFYYGKGCSECTQGFKGRIGIFEVMGITPEIEDLAVAKRPANEIKDVAMRDGMITMKQDGIIKALQGLTTIDEILQATTNN